MSDGDRQRIDKWLWFARVVKTRALAQELAASGKVRLNGRKVDAPSQAVKSGDVLTIGIHGRVRVLKVASFAERRGSHPDALRLFEDLSPPAEPAENPDGGEDGAAPQVVPAAPAPVRGEGRPTKRDRRRLDRFDADG